MPISKDKQDLIEAIAGESLAIFEEVAERAKTYLANVASTGATAFASINTWTSIEAVRNRERINYDNVEAYRILSCEPSIARVVISDENGIKTTYYICRAAPVAMGNTPIKLASYRSPVGRLASLPVGAEHTLQRDGRAISVEILECARFHPTLTDQKWDSENSVFEGDTYGPLTIESLRDMLKREIGEDLLDSLLKEETEAVNVREGLRRNVIRKMGLRDQPILDQYQDNIFRLPLNSRLLILGAPGTGKTTTLIRRLGQKLDAVFLEEDEKRIIGAGTFGKEDNQAQSWVMFTPTELLKLYVKEAFNREGIPASDDHISTWADYRADLARNDFGILRSVASRSSFVMKDNADTLTPGAETDQIAWFTAFDQWQKAAFWQEMRASAQSLNENLASDIAELGRRILTILDKAGTTPQPSSFVSLMEVVSEIKDLVEKLKDSTDKKIRGALNFQVNLNRNFLDEIADFIEGLSEVNDETEDQDTYDDEGINQPQVRRITALVAHDYYMRAVRIQARAQAKKRSVAKESLNGSLIKWLGDRSLAKQDLQNVGESLVVQSALRWFVNPVRRFIDGVPARYRRFRRVQQDEGCWYRGDGFSSTDIHPLEVDIILLTMMRGTNDLVQVMSVGGIRDTENLVSPILERLQCLYRTQVLVDEATDFSPIQLACMATMAQPGIQSFFACGDFNQRVTNWGIRSVEEMKWVVPDIDIRAISVAFRQTRQLHDLARQIVGLAGASAATVVLPDNVDNEGVSPVLRINIAEVRQLQTGWPIELRRSRVSPANSRPLQYL